MSPRERLWLRSRRSELRATALRVSNLEVSASVTLPVCPCSTACQPPPDSSGVFGDQKGLGFAIPRHPSVDGYRSDGGPRLNTRRGASPHWQSDPDWA